MTETARADRKNTLFFLRGKKLFRLVYIFSVYTLCHLNLPEKLFFNLAPTISSNEKRENDEKTVSIQLEVEEVSSESSIGGVLRLSNKKKILHWKNCY